MNKNEIKKSFVETLNEALMADPAAILTIINNRVKCNSELANHPTVMVGLNNESFEVGVLGLINGIYTKITGKIICYEFDENGNIIQFKELSK